MNEPSLRRYLSLHLLTLICIVLVISGLFSYVQAISFSNESYDHALLENLRGISQKVKLEGGRIAVELTPEAIDMFRSDTRDHIYYQVRSKDQRILSGDAVMPEPPMLDWRLVPAKGEAPPLYYNAIIKGEQVRVAAIPMALSPDLPPLVVQSGETRNKRDSMAGDIVLAVVIPQLALIVLSWYAIQRGVGYSLAPLERMAHAMGVRQRDDLTPLPVDQVPEETRPLILAFNRILGRLSEATEAQRRFIADAAHQLRTPLAALRITLERALREPDQQMRENLMNQLVMAIERTTRLSSQLLLLSRAEPGAVRPPHIILDMRSLAFEIGSQWVPKALQLGKDLGFAGPEYPVYVRGDPMMLGDLINNLVDNALNYGGTQITLRIDQDERKRTVLSIEDNGIGIPASQREHIFERFHRLPGSKGEGSGLGLAIVREIAQGHGAELDLDEPSGGGTRFTVCFPAMQPQAE